jgi:hypothetical protein
MYASNGNEPTAQELLPYWVTEREKIRKAKAANLRKPWSDDPVFQSVYFCNVRREDDRVTKWIRTVYTPEFFGERYEIAIATARIFNWPETLTDIRHDLLVRRWENIAEILESRAFRGKKIWGGAYVITTHGIKMPKLDYCVNILSAMDEFLPVPDAETCAEYHAYLQSFEGFGSFLAAQVVADLKWTHGHPLATAPDWNTFAAPGPGSLRGLHWFYHDKQGSYPPGRFKDGLGGVRCFLERTPAKEIVQTICNQDLQNVMCEFDKYMRVRRGVGRSKRRYQGT